MNVARSARPRSAALACATCSAAALMSVPNPRASGSSRSNASRIAPEPVPRSAIRHEWFLGRFLGPFAAGLARSISSASSTTVSVSGRGTNVSAESLSGNPQNSLMPRMRATGSPPRRRRTKSSRRADSSGESSRFAAIIMPVRSRPSTAPIKSRASSSAEPIPPEVKRVVRLRRALSTVCPAKD